ncbi:MAG: hypothetical protein ACK4UN_08880 [Limisphaerales bacterium]
MLTPVYEENPFLLYRTQGYLILKSIIEGGGRIVRITPEENPYVDLQSDEAENDATKEFFG